MTHLRLLGGLAAAFLVFAGMPAVAQEFRAGDLRIERPWSRATPPASKVGAGYLALVNGGAAADRLVAASSPAAGRVEIHEMRMDGSVMRMRELEKGVEIPPGGTVVLKPGGYHIMFMELKAPFAKDTKVPVTLVFEKAGTIDVPFTVEAMGAGARH